MPPADFEGAFVEASLFPLASGGAITAAVNTALGKSALHLGVNCGAIGVIARYRWVMNRGGRGADKPYR